MAQYASRLVLGLLAVPLMMAVPAFAQNQVSIIPKPVLVEIHEGTYVFPSATPLYAFESFMDIAGLLAEHPVAHFTAVERIRSYKRIPETGIRLVEARKEDRLATDAYRLVVDTSGIVITAHQPAAMLNGVLTVLQLAYTQPNGRELPAMLIEDRPRFAYRGLYLDVSSHFYPLSFLEKFINLMALYKFNTFHWHLTGGAGWRLEIKKYPELTQKAAWRTHTVWKDWQRNGQRYLEAGAPNASGGYYTQQEVRELVAYAARRGITIIPEVEIPGHSEEVLAVYPQLSCTGIPYHHAAFCIGNEETFTFLTNVLDEVIELFPAQYIHIGGDEVDTVSWAACPKCHARMEEEGLKAVGELQHYAVGRIDSFLRSKGRTLMGWEEIHEGELPPGAAVISRLEETVGTQLANEGHDVIMAPHSFYFDQYQSDPRNQPEATGGYLPLRSVYAYEPIPKEAEAAKVKHMLGTQGTIQTEYMPTTEGVEYMAFPRALALAEVVWSDAKHREWGDFYKRLQNHYQLLQRLNVNYYKPSYVVDIDVHFNTDTLTNTISLSTEQYRLGIRYTTDGKEPDTQSPLYTKPIELAMSATIQAAYFVDSARVGPIAVAKADIHRAIRKSIAYQTPWDEGYAAQRDSTLLNGQKGGKWPDDGQWQGFANNLDVTVDFERREALNTVALRFLQDATVGAYQPGEVTVLLSDNGKNFREVGVLKNDIAPDEKFRKVKTYTFNFDTPQTARYVRVVATNAQNALLLTDEVVVY